MKYKLKHCVEYGLLRTIQGLLNLFPLDGISRFLQFFFRVVFRVAWPKKERTIARIRDVFGDSLSMAQMRRIARDSLYNMVMNMVELMRIGSIDERWLARHIRDIDLLAAHLKSLISQYGGIVIALPHMGNWDLAGFACIVYGIPLMAIARKQNNPLVEAWLTRNRRDFQSLDRASFRSYLKVAHHLHSGGVLAILPDVRSPKPDLMVPFLGKDVPLGQGMARFARMADVPIIPVVARRERHSHHVITLADPVLPDQTADEKADIERMTACVMAVFDPEIRKTPGQWFWYNKRWILEPLKK